MPELSPEILVMPIPTSDGERFVLLHPLELMYRADASTWLGRFRQAMDEAPRLTETEAREALDHLGLSADAVDAQLTRGRDIASHSGSMSPADIAWERTTALGYRNRHGQVVAARTEVAGSGPFERLYALTCERCGHEHAAEGRVIHVTRCPHCAPSPT